MRYASEFRISSPVDFHDDWDRKGGIGVAEVSHPTPIPWHSNGSNRMAKSHVRAKSRATVTCTRKPR